MSTSVLLLNASFEPLHIVSARRAIKLIMAGKAVSLDDSPKHFRSADEIITVPYVAILRRQIKKTTSTRSAKFSRRGVLIRDGFTCVYCGKHGDTIDHILPRSRGGRDSYENCVASCKRCNHRKGNKLLSELGWSTPVVKPTPSIYESFLLRAKVRGEQQEIWEKYISYYLPKR